ncbi:MAG: efflux RND transporter permease subunit [Steroidobacteraceae bacterium]
MGHPPPGSADRAVVVLTCVGIVSFIRLPINQNPDIDYPIVDIFISQPGAAPAEIENQILQKVEGAVAGIGSVRNISSQASEGSAEVFIEFQIGTLPSIGRSRTRAMRCPKCARICHRASRSRWCSAFRSPADPSRISR